MSQYPPGYRPARRAPSKQMMYRRRRAAVLGVLLVVIILIIVGFSKCSSGDAAVIPTTTPTQPVPAPTSSTIPNVGATPAATPGAPIAGVDHFGELMVLTPREAIPPPPPEAKARGGDGGNEKGMRPKKQRAAKAK